MPDDIDDSDDNEEEDDDDDNDDEDDALSPVPIEMKKPIIRVDFKPFNFLVQQHENTEPTESNPTKYSLYCLVSFEWIYLWFRMNMHVTQLFS